MVQVLVDHRLAICSLIVVLNFWRAHVDARRKSFQVRVNLLLQELSSILVLPTFPWLLLVVTCCSLSLSVVSLGASVIPPLLRICTYLPKDMGEACAHSFCVASASRGRRAVSRRFLVS